MTSSFKDGCFFSVAGQNVLTTQQGGTKGANKIQETHICKTASNWMYSSGDRDKVWRRVPDCSTNKLSVSSIAEQYKANWGVKKRCDLTRESGWWSVSFLAFMVHVCKPQRTGTHPHQQSQFFFSLSLPPFSPSSFLPPDVTLLLYVHTGSDFSPSFSKKESLPTLFLRLKVGMLDKMLP